MIAKSASTHWVLHPRHAPDRARAVASALGAPPAFGHILVNRGMETLEAARHFLDPSLDQLHDPFLLMDMDRAVERVQRAIKDGERILVQGDYDVDGITSTVVLLSTLRELGGHAEYRIPHRTRDGYGLSTDAVEEAARLGSTLIVTVDCGITAIEAVEHGRALGIDTVVTDHHEPGARLPDAIAVVNPRRTDCAYPFKSLAGVGVTFKLAQALFGVAGRPQRAFGFLDVVALGTIADVVPVVGENRILSRLGLEHLNGTERPGLRALIEVAGLSGKRITGGHVAFVLAPRMNAAGRMGNADQSLHLLLARDRGEGLACAESLEEDNLRRREFDERVALEASERVHTELGWPECSSILLWSETWHPGVLGIVASRLAERFHRPTVLVALEGDRGRGSGRSVSGLDLTRVLDGCSDLLDAYGGHAFAAGLTVTRERLPALRQRLEQLVRERLAPDDCVSKLEIDADLTLQECDLDLIHWLERAAPHGLDNPEPVFRTREAIVDSVQRVGGGRHLRLSVRDATGARQAIGFGLGEQSDGIAKARRCALAFTPERNDWKGETRIQLRLREVQGL